MIKFFRNIRKSLLHEGKTGKYLKYALGEIVLVVIGISAKETSFPTTLLAVFAPKAIQTPLRVIVSEPVWSALLPTLRATLPTWAMVAMASPCMTTQALNQTVT